MFYDTPPPPYEMGTTWPDGGRWLKKILFIHLRLIDTDPGSYDKRTLYNILLLYCFSPILQPVNSNLYCHKTPSSPYFFFGTRTSSPSFSSSLPIAHRLRLHILL